MKRIIEGGSYMPNRLAVVALAGMLGMVAVSGHADFSWGNSETNMVAGHDGVPLPWYDNGTEGCFVQLIWAGLTVDSADPFIASGTGVTGNDQVIQTSFIGLGSLSEAGLPSGISQNELFSGGPIGYYYVRVFDTPSPDFGAGLAASVPTTDSYWYAETTNNLWFHPGGTDPISGLPNQYAFDFGGAGDANGNGLITDHQVAIPEPTVFGLGIIGLVSLGLFSRKRK
jgi:hypothetical protein